MDPIIIIISAAVSVLLYLLIYNQLSAISKKLDAQSKYYSKLLEDKQLEAENAKYQKAFSQPKVDS